MYVLPAAPSAPVTERLRRLPRYGPEPSGRPLLHIGSVAALYSLAQLLLVLPGTGLGWDETVYVSQTDAPDPAAFFSAPRARGISYLVAPLVSFTGSTPLLRLYLAVLSGAALFAALWVWRRMVPPAVLAWGGALFAGLWTSLFYGPQAMPNLWCAFGSLAAAGLLLRCVRDGPRAEGRRALAGLALCVGGVALMRPPDAAWLVLALGGAALLVPAWRRRAVFAALAGGAAAGVAPWVAEAFSSYGGLFARLRRASEIQGGMGWNIAAGDHVRALQGRMLCRPCDMAWEQPHTAVWWFALPLLAGAGIAAASRAGRRDTAVLATATAVVLALPYLFLMGYAAPRFLLPSYALLALPVGECVRRAFAPRRYRRRPGPPGWGPAGDPGGSPEGRRPLPLVLLPVLLLAGHLVVQYQVLESVLGRNHTQTTQLTETAQAVRRLGLRPPCTLTGSFAVPAAHYAGCVSRQATGHDANITREGLRRLAERGEPMAVTKRGGQSPPLWARSWPVERLDHPPGYRVYVTPRAG